LVGCRQRTAQGHSDLPGPIATNVEMLCCNRYYPKKASYYSLPVPIILSDLPLLSQSLYYDRFLSCVSMTIMSQIRSNYPRSRIMNPPSSGLRERGNQGVLFPADYYCLTLIPFSQPLSLYTLPTIELFSPLDSTSGATTWENSPIASQHSLGTATYGVAPQWFAIFRTPSS